METYLKAGIFGIISTSTLRLLIPNIALIPPFLPAFIMAIAMIILFNLGDFREALVVGLMSYYFSDVLLGVFSYGVLYYQYLTEPIAVTLQLSAFELIALIITPLTSLGATYLGTYYVKLRNTGRTDLVNGESM